MSYNHHQPQLSVNSIQSLVEPVTPPPVGQMNNKKNHQKAQSLDLSGFNQFITSQPPMILSNNNNNSSIQDSGLVAATSSTLPLINEFESSVPRKSSSSVASSVSASSNNNNTSSRHDPTRANSRGNNNNNNNNNRNNSVSNATNNEPISAAEIANTPLEDLDYLKLSTDQFGCRFLQKKLESNSVAESNLVRDLMFDQIKSSFLNLILDPFGNYLIQKICEFLTTEQKTILIESIYPYVFKISINQYGTRSLQKIIDTVDNESQIDLIIRGFSADFTSIEQVVTLINDLNGNHVIQKCIFKFPSTKFDFIINAIVEKNNIITISTHKHGCCVLQKLLNVCTIQQIYKISLKIIQFLPGLINDQFGNYIIQFLLDIKELDYYLLNELFNKLSNELIQLSCLKFSSNVIEKFVKKLFHIVRSSIKGEILPNITDDVVNQTMNILLTIIDCFTINLNILIRDNYGNYALQTLLDVKNYNVMLNYPDNMLIVENTKYLSFAVDFTNKISNLILLTKDLLPSIKTTSYAKKIKLKVRAYIELTGITSNDLKNNISRNGNNVNIQSNNSINMMNYSLNAGNNDNVNNNNLSVNMNGSNSFNNYSRQHQRHFSLPANAYHRRNSSVASSASSNFMNDKRLNNLPNVPSTQSLHNTMVNIFNSQNTSPIGFQQQQQQQQSLLMNDNQYTNLSVPFSNMSISGNDSQQMSQLNTTPQLQQSSIFFLNDNQMNNISSHNSSANLYQQNPLLSNGNNNSNVTLNNDIMSTPNPNMMYSKFAFTSPNPLMTSSNNDLSFLTPQPQRVVSNPYPQPSFITTSATNNNNNNITNPSIAEQQLSFNDTSLMFLGDDEFKSFTTNINGH